MREQAAGSVPGPLGISRAAPDFDGTSLAIIAQRLIRPVHLQRLLEPAIDDDITVPKRGEFSIVPEGVVIVDKLLRDGGLVDAHFTLLRVFRGKNPEWLSD